MTVNLDGDQITIRTYCRGPSYDKKTENATNPAILLEVGGGSAAVDLIGI